MSKQINHFFEFGSVKLDATNRLLYKNGDQLPLQPRLIETLLVLVKNANTVVDKDTLLNVVWQDVIVEEGGLKRNISLLRKALGAEGQFIETLPKRGYRFAGEVKENWEESNFYGPEDLKADLVLQRRANLRITHEEEEIEDSGDAHTKVVRASKASLPRRANPLLLGAITAFMSAIGLGVLWVANNRSAAAQPIKSIAVLPFRNLSARGDDQVLGVGITDALITRLSSLNGLNVRPTSAVMKFTDKDQDSIGVGQTLRVDAVLEGTIYKVDDRMRVTTRLLRVNDQSPIWAAQFDERADDFIMIQNAISQQVAGSLSRTLSRTERDALTKRYTESADAYQLYATGRYHWNKRSGDGVVQAERFFRNAIERDPSFALAYLGLADTLTMRGVYEESKLAIEKAIVLDAGLGEVYASRGFWQMFRGWQWAAAEADFKRSIELNPGYGTAHQWYATLLAIIGRVSDAKSEMQRALEIDPTSHNFLADMGQMHYFAREYDEAESYCQQALDIYPDFVFARAYLSGIYLKKGEDSKAFEEDLKHAKAVYIGTTVSEEMLAKFEAAERDLFRRSGNKGRWRQSIEQLLNRKGDLFQYSNLVKYYTLVGEREKALENLEKSYENHDFMLPFVNVDPLYDDLRSDPRFQGVLRRMGLGS